MNKEFKASITRAVNDANLTGALGKFSEAYKVNRAKAYEGIDFESLRQNIADRKAYAATHIDLLAAAFKQKAEALGAKVFQADSPEKVKEYILKVARDNNVKNVVKSKSMASEEIHLNAFLEKNDISVKETDLGEWIIQLAGQRPSHMVMPAIHLNRQQCADYFSQELGENIPADIPFMVQTARKNLRGEFLQADMGISGANIAIAENGAICLFTNEGNGRLATTLPRIHVAIVGYEKLIPTIKDALPIARLLPRNATAQMMTSYFSMISGPSPTLIKRDGEWIEEEKELHIILFDNGRLEAARDEKFKQIFQCVRCAGCLNVCTTYQLVGGHVYGHIYAGGIGAILTAFVNSMEDFEQFSDLCIGCRKCTEVCPGKIDIPGLIEELRNRSVQKKGLPFMLRTLFHDIIANRRLFHTLLRAGSVAQKPVQSGQFIRHLPLFMAGLAKDRSLPAIAKVPLRDEVASIIKKPTSPSKKVAFFSGCAIDFVLPDTGKSVIKVLQDLNIEVIFPEDQGCCGKPALGYGATEAVVIMAKNNIRAFEAANPDVIIAACPTCVETWHTSYPELLAGEPEWQERAATLASKTREFSQFVAEEYKATGKSAAISNNSKVTLHDSCHQKRVLGISQEPRDLIDAAGCTFVEMKDPDKCCGMSGVFGIVHTELSMPILQQKMDNIQNVSADTVAVTCPGCMIQIRGGLDKTAPQIKVKHVADILAESIT